MNRPMMGDSVTQPAQGRADQPGADAAMAVRREVLGDDKVPAMSDLSVADQDFQRYVTDVVWSTWARPGLSRRERSLIVLAMSAALSQMPEFELHVVGAVRNGLAEHDLRELVMQVVAYCGAPAGVQAKRALMRALDGMADQPG